MNAVHFQSYVNILLVHFVVMNISGWDRKLIQVFANVDEIALCIFVVYMIKWV